MLRRRSWREIIVEVQKGENWFTHALEGFEFAWRLDVADRAANGLRLSCLGHVNDNTQISDFGRDLHTANDDPRYADHNHAHFRRQERHQEALVMNIGFLRHGELSIHNLIDSLGLFPYWHDAGQLLRIYRNDRENTNLDTKHGHGLEAAIMILVLHERYAKERNIRVREAWRICAGAAVMMMIHDEPEHFQERIQSRRPAHKIDEKGNKVFLQGEELLRQWQEREVDIFSLTPAQMLDLYKNMMKPKPGFVTSQTPNGLYPAFEAEYKMQLEALENNWDPLIVDISAEDKKTIELIAEVSLRADFLDIITPYAEALARSFLAQYSRRRPFWPSEQTNALVNQIFIQKGNISPDKDSDVRRILWEFLHVEFPSESEMISQSRYVKKINQDNTIMGLLAFRHMGATIMRGDLSDIEAIYNRRKLEIVQKSWRRAGYSRIARIVFNRMYKYLEKYKKDTDRFVEILLDSSSINPKSVLAKRKYLDQELKAIEQNFYNKPDGAKGLKVYTEDDIDKFLAVVDTSIQHMCRQYGVGRLRLKYYDWLVSRGQYSSAQPFRYYDSLGGTPKTLIKPLRLAPDEEL